MTDQEFNPPPGIAETLEPGLRRVLAPNPSPMTYRGTNTYLLGEDEIVVIDPGPSNAEHLDALLSAIGKARVTHILVTHAHLDHSRLARALSQATGAPAWAFGPATKGRRPVMEDLAAQGLAGGGEGIDTAFAPDVILEDAQVLTTPAGPIEVLWTPGHLSNHLSFAWHGAVFTGDHVMGWASSLISPPDGDIAAFMASCRRLATRNDRVYYPGHGAPINTPQARLAWLMEHRLARETAILAALDHGPATPADIARLVYQDTPATLLPAAARNVFAHLIDLTERGHVSPQNALGPDSHFCRSAPI